MVLAEVDSASRIIYSTIAARLSSSAWNFMLNQKFVFQSTGKVLQKAGKYYMLCFFEMLFSALGVTIINYMLAGNEVIEKIIVDSILFLVSFKIQHFWVFAEHK